MTELDRTTQSIADWLEAQPTEAPDRLLDAVLRDLRRTPQRGRWRVAARSLPMFGPAVMRFYGAAAAVALVALAGFALWSRQPAVGPAQPSPTLSPTPATTGSPVAWSGPEVISAQAFGRFDVAIDLDGHTHVAAVAADGSGIFYVTDESGPWTTQRLTTAPTGGVEGLPAIAVDRDGSLWVSFTRATACSGSCLVEGTTTNFDDRYLMDNTSGSWSVPVAFGTLMDDPEFYWASYFELAVDRGAVRVVHSGAFGASYATNVSGAWQLTGLGAVGAGPHLALTATGMPLIAFADPLDYPSRELRFASDWSAGNGFSIAGIPNTAGALWGIPGVDANGVTRLVFRRESDPAGTYVLKMTDGRWGEPRLVSREWVIDPVFDADGNVHYLYVDGLWYVWYATDRPGAAPPHQILSQSLQTVGLRQVQVVVDPSGTPLVVFDNDQLWATRPATP